MRLSCDHQPLPVWPWQVSSPFTLSSPHGMEYRVPMCCSWTAKTHNHRCFRNLKLTRRLLSTASWEMRSLIDVSVNGWMTSLSRKTLTPWLILFNNTFETITKQLSISLTQYKSLRYVCTINYKVKINKN